MNVYARNNKWRGAAKAFKQQYFYSGEWHTPSTWSDESAESKYNRLLIATSANEVDEIIGNNSWTFLTCDCCFEKVERVVELCHNPSCVVCKNCLQDALEVIS